MLSAYFFVAFILNRLNYFFIFAFFLWNCINVNKVEQILVKKKTKIVTRQIYKNFPWKKLKKPSVPEKVDIYWKDGVALSGNIFATLCHSMAKGL